MNILNTAIRPITINDLNEITYIHINAFPDSALTRLGREAVHRYYEWQLVGPHDAVNIGAESGKELQGFCFGGIFRGALGGFLEKNKSYLVRRVLTHPWLLLNPLVRQRAEFAVKRIFQRLRSQKTLLVPNSTIPATKAPPSFGILSIAVEPRYQGSEVATLLMEYAERTAIERGFQQMNLSVHPSNGRAIRFYEKLGWERMSIDGRWDGKMHKSIGALSMVANTQPD